MNLSKSENEPAENEPEPTANEAHDESQTQRHEDSLTILEFLQANNLADDSCDSNNGIVLTAAQLLALRSHSIDQQRSLQNQLTMRETAIGDAVDENHGARTVLWQQFAQREVDVTALEIENLDGMTTEPATSDGESTDSWYSVPSYWLENNADVALNLLDTEPDDDLSSYDGSDF